MRRVSDDNPTTVGHSLLLDFGELVVAVCVVESSNHAAIPIASEGLIETIMSRIQMTRCGILTMRFAVEWSFGLSSSKYPSIS